MHGVRNAVIEIDRAHESLNPAEAHILSDIVTDTGESDGDALTLQLLDKCEQLVAGANGDKVY
jgi:hypothetical protein